MYVFLLQGPAVLREGFVRLFTDLLKLILLHSLKEPAHVLLARLQLHPLERGGREEERERQRREEEGERRRREEEGERRRREEEGGREGRWEEEGEREGRRKEEGERGREGRRKRGGREGENLKRRVHTDARIQQEPEVAS